MLLSFAVLAWWATRPPRVKVNFITYPFEATIYLDGTLLTDPDGIPYRTPHTVPDLPARAHRVVFRHDELGELTVGSIDFARKRQIVGRWTPSPNSPTI